MEQEYNKQCKRCKIWMKPISKGWFCPECETFITLDEGANQVTLTDIYLELNVINKKLDKLFPQEP